MQKEVEKASKKYTNYRIALENVPDESKELFKTITDRIFQLYDVGPKFFLYWKQVRQD
jgi:hypothetical protein